LVITVGEGKSSLAPNKEPAPAAADFKRKSLRFISLPLLKDIFYFLILIIILILLITRVNWKRLRIGLGLREKLGKKI
jgi:hypothetical protein